MKQFDEFDEWEDAGQDANSIDFRPYLKLALKNWKRILLWAFCGSVIGIIIGFSTPKTYTTKAVIAPEIATRSTLGNGLSSLASLAGVNMNTMALTDAMHPDLYPEVIKSTNFKVSLFDMPVTVATKDSLVHTDLYDYMVNYCKAPWWGPILGFPHVAMAWVKGLFVEEDEFDNAEGHEHIDSLRLTKQQEMVVKALTKNISASVEKRTYVLSLKVTMQDPVIAAQLANEIIRKLQEFVVSYRTEKAVENVEYYELVYEETRKEYEAVQKAYAYYADANAGFTSNSAKIRMQQLQNEVQLRYQMYNTTAQNLLAARAKVQQEAPVLVVVQPGIAPHYGKPSKVKLALLWFVLGGALGAVWVVFKNKNNIQNEGK